MRNDTAMLDVKNKVVSKLLEQLPNSVCIQGRQTRLVSSQIPLRGTSLVEDQARLFPHYYFNYSEGTTFIIVPSTDALWS